MTVNLQRMEMYQNQEHNNNKNVGVAAGLGTYLVGKQLLSTPTLGIQKYMKKVNSSLNTDEINRLSDTFDSAFKQSGLEQKGVQVLRVNKLNIADAASNITNKHYDNISQKIPQNIKNTSGFKESLKQSIYGKTQKQLETVANGNNAFFHPKINSILLPEKGTGLQLSSFHEMGHALNKHTSKIGKALQKLRPLQFIAPLGIMIIALSSKEKANSAEGKGGAKEFIKDNAGILATMSWIPTIAEEALATKKGNFIAKNALSATPDLLKKIKKTNALGLATYIMVAAATGIATTLAVKVKDNIQAKKDQTK